MRQLILSIILLAGISGGATALGKEFNSTEALTQATDFITRLKEDTPFTFAEEEKYFGPLTLYSVALMTDLGFVDQAGRWKKSKPRYSYLCELIRMNSSLLLLKSPEVEYIFSGIPKELSRDNSWDDRLFSAEITFVQHEKSIPAGYAGKTKIVNFQYNTPGGRLAFPIYVNGESLAELIGFEFAPPKGLPVLSEKAKKKLLEHMNSLE